MTPVTFFKSESCIRQVQRSKSNREARKLSGAWGAKRQTSARSANAWATPGWSAGMLYFVITQTVYVRLGCEDVNFAH